MPIDFLANPVLVPNAGCIAEMRPPAWIIPGRNPL